MIFTFKVGIWIGLFDFGNGTQIPMDCVQVVGKIGMDGKHYLHRRFFIIVFLLALARCATMFLTQVPIADARNKYCAPKLAPEESTFWRIFKRAFETFFWQGIQVDFIAELG